MLTEVKILLKALGGLLFLKHPILSLQWQVDRPLVTDNIMLLRDIDTEGWYKWYKWKL